MRTTDGVPDLDDVRERLVNLALAPKSEEIDLAAGESQPATPTTAALLACVWLLRPRDGCAFSTYT